MTYIHYHGRRGVTALLCVYMIVINGLAMGAPPDVDASGDGTSPPRDLAYYAGDASFNRDLKDIDLLIWQSDSLYQSLSYIASAPPEFNASDEFKGNQKWCATLMGNVEHVRRDARKYAELKRLIDEYNIKIGESRQEGVTPERKAELSAAMENLEQDFQDKLQLVLGYRQRALITQFAKKLADADDVIQIYKDGIPSAPQSPVQVLEGDTDTSNDQNATQPADVRVKPERSKSPLLNSKEHPGALGKSSLLPFKRIEVAQKYLTDRSLFTRMDKLQDYANKIINAVCIPLSITYGPRSANEHIRLLNKHKRHSKKCYEDFCENLTHLLRAWEIMKRYNDISDEWGGMDPKSPEAIKLEEEKYRLEWRFIFSMYLVEEEFLAKNEQEITQYWNNLQIEDEELKLRISSCTSGFAADGTTEMSSNNAPESETTDAVKTESIGSGSSNIRSVSD